MTLTGVGVEKVGLVFGFSEARACMLAPLTLGPGRYQRFGWPAEEPDQAFDVLGSSRQEELLSDELQPTQAQATKTDLTLEVCEQCFDLLPLPLCLLELRSCPEIWARCRAASFIWIARYRNGPVVHCDLCWHGPHFVRVPI